MVLRDHWYTVITDSLDKKIGAHTLGDDEGAGAGSTKDVDVVTGLVVVCWTVITGVGVGATDVCIYAVNLGLLDQENAKNAKNMRRR